MNVDLFLLHVLHVMDICYSLHTLSAKVFPIVFIKKKYNCGNIFFWLANLSSGKQMFPLTIHTLAET